MVNRERRALRMQLLRGGVAPKHVKRILRELGNHYSDLKDKALAEGLSEEQAAQRAEARLGDRRLIAEEALARPELKSWSHRWAWVAYGVVPIVLFAVFLFVSVLTGIGVINVLKAVTGIESDIGYHIANSWLGSSLVEGWRLFAMYGLPVVLAAGICVFAAKREARPGWPIAGVILISLIGYAYGFYIEFPEAPGEMGEIGMGVGLEHPFSARTFRFLVPLLVALGPYLWWRTHSRRQST